MQQKKHIRSLKSVLEVEPQAINCYRPVYHEKEKVVNDMYVGSLICWGIAQQNFYTENEEELRLEYCYEDKENLHFRCSNESMIKLHILYAPVFWQLGRFKNLGKARFYCFCKKPLKEQVLPESAEKKEKGKKENRGRSRSKSKKKKKKESDTQFSESQGEEKILSFFDERGKKKKKYGNGVGDFVKALPVRIDIFYGKDFFTENSKGYLSSIERLNKEKFRMSEPDFKKWQDEDKLRLKHEIGEIEKQLNPEKIVRSFLLSFIEKTNVQVINRSFIKPPPRLVSHLRQYKRLTIGHKKFDIRTQHKLEKKIQEWKRKFGLTNRLYHCYMNNFDLNSYYKQWESNSIMWRRYDNENGRRISKNEIMKYKMLQKFYSNKNLFLDSFNDDELKLFNDNRKSILEEIGGSYFENDDESDSDDDEVTTTKKEGLKKEDKELIRKNELLVKKFQQENKFFREHPNPSNMISVLKPYQKQALQWMKYRQGKIPVEELFEEQYLEEMNEVQFQRKLSPFWEEVKLIGGQHFYANYLTGEITQKFHDWKAIRGGILADEMGLGKTVMTLALLADENYEGLNLIVVPVNVAKQWIDQAQKHCDPNIRIIEYNAIPVHKRKSVDLYEYNIIVVSYQTLGAQYKNFVEKQKENLILDYKFKRVILDEAHEIKNTQTLAFKAVSQLESQFSWCLTGTLIQNNVQELFAIFKFLKVEVFSEEYWWNIYVKNSGSLTSRINIIQTVLRPIVLRRTKASTSNSGESILKLTDRKFNVIYPEFTSKEWVIYKRLESGMREYFQINSEKREYTHVFQIIGKLRQFCCHPSLIFKGNIEDIEEKDIDFLLGQFIGKQSEEYKNSVYEQVKEENQICLICLEELDDNNMAITHCGHIYCFKCIQKLVSERRPCAMCRTTLDKKSYKKKLELMGNIEKKCQEEIENIKESSKEKAVMKVIYEIIERGEKCVIFTQWIKMMDIVCNRFLHEDIGFEIIKGSITSSQRQKSVKKFRQNENCRFLVVSIRAGSTGLNLTCANNVMLLDPWWNPSQEDQAFARVHRIGQEKNVNIYRFLMKGSIEEKMEKMHQKKRFLANQVMMQGEKGGGNKFTMSEWINLLGNS